MFTNVNTSFTTIFGFDKLKSTGFLHINDNTSLTSLPTFNSIETIKGINAKGAFNISTINIRNHSGFNSLKIVQGGPS